jgi:hypothetical protein
LICLLWGFLVKTVFYVIDFEAAATLSGGEPRPIEIGICAFRLQDNGFSGGGKDRKDSAIKHHSFVELAAFHAFINPGRVPAEVMKQVRYVERNVHGIPLARAQAEAPPYAQLWAGT